jgi:hypothetical protein
VEEIESQEAQYPAREHKLGIGGWLWIGSHDVAEPRKEHGVGDQ